MDPQEFAPKPGVMEQLVPGVRRILAPNPSPMTYRGTNTYVVGKGAVAVIDPGPALPAHLEAILEGLAPGETVSHIFVTHSHVDHSPLARALSKRTGAPVLAFGDSQAGRSAVMQDLAAQGLAGGGEGVDQDFKPDEVLRDGEVVHGAGWSLTALWTPGHFCNHMSFAMGDAVFTGDLVMGWASTMVSPPDGDLTGFMASCARLLERSDRVFYPGHGPAITDPRGRTEWLVAHRQSREAQILNALAGTPCMIPDLTREVYHDVAPALLPAAARNLFAHLIDLAGRGIVQAHPALSDKAAFQKVKK